MRLSQQLLVLGADVTLRSRWTNMNALHYAAYFDVPDLVRVLLKGSRPRGEQGSPALGRGTGPSKREGLEAEGCPGFWGEGCGVKKEVCQTEAWLGGKSGPDSGHTGRLEVGGSRLAALWSTPSGQD